MIVLAPPPFFPARDFEDVRGHRGEQDHEGDFGYADDAEVTSPDRLCCGVFDPCVAGLDLVAAAHTVVVLDVVGDVGLPERHLVERHGDGGLLAHGRLGCGVDDRECCSDVDAPGPQYGVLACWLVRARDRVLGERAGGAVQLQPTVVLACATDGL